MSLATRRSASARWSWWRTSSACWAAATTAPTATATRPSRSGSIADGSARGTGIEDEHAPRAARSRDGDRGLGPATDDRADVVRRDRERLSSRPRRGPRRARRSPAAARRAAWTRGRRSRRDGASRRGARRSRRPGAGRGRRSPWPRRPTRPMPCSRARDPGQADEEVEVDPVPVRRGRRRPRAQAAGRCELGLRRGRGGRAVSVRWRSCPRRDPSVGAGALGQAALRRREEALEVAEAVAPVAAWVDPVIAKATGVGPGPNRVRVHAQQARGLRDGQGRVDRS